MYSNTYVYMCMRLAENAASVPTKTSPAKTFQTLIY